MLATLSSHLGRFFAHADELLEECQSFGESVRGSLDTHLGKLNGTVAEAMAEAGERAAGQLDGHVERAIGDRLRALRQELDELNSLAAQSTTQVRDMAQDAGRAGRLTRSATVPEPVRARPGLGLLGLLLVAANLMLAALLLVGILRQDTGGTAGAAGPAALCEELAAKQDPDVARAFVAAAAARSCEQHAGAVTTSVLQSLVTE